MRVSFEHEQQGKHFLLRSTIEFSEEEKAIIAQRGFADKTLSVGYATPSGSGITSGGMGATGMQLLSRLLVVAGIVFIFTNMIFRTPEMLPILCFIIAAVIFGIRKMGEGKSEKSYEERSIPFRKIIADPTITSYTSDLPQAKMLEESIRNQLTLFKELFKESVTVPTKQTYEI
jgi:hypothetical protein